MTDADHNELVSLVGRYVDVMEEFDFGCAIADSEHSHHEDWLKANLVLIRCGALPSSLFRQWSDSITFGPLDAPLWTMQEHLQAFDEGWQIVRGAYGAQIGRYSVRFDGSAAASAYVSLSALKGSALARRAIECIAHDHAVSDAADAARPENASEAH